MDVSVTDVAVACLLAAAEWLLRHVLAVLAAELQQEERDRARRGGTERERERDTGDAKKLRFLVA